MFPSLLKDLILSKDMSEILPQLLFSMKYVELKHISEEKNNWVPKDWAQVPQSKNSIRGISEGGDYFYLFQQVKLRQFAKFHGCIVNRNRFTILTYYTIC